jgi:hypothetical protein
VKDTSAARREDGDAASETGAPFVSFEEFRSGLPQGRFRVIVDPTRATAFVSTRVNAAAISIAAVGCGIAAALAGYVWTGGLLVAGAIVFRRLVRSQAPKIALHLASSHAATYLDATAGGVMEVQRVRRNG